MTTSDLDAQSCDEAKGLLLRDYDYLADSFWKSEQSGETRLNLFIGLVTLMVGIVVKLGLDEHVKREQFGQVAAGSLFGLFLLGVITFLRMLRRNEFTDECKCGLDAIRQRVKDHFDPNWVLTDYYPLAQHRFSAKSRNKAVQGSKRIFGGLAHIVAVLNSLLLGAAAATGSYFRDHAEHWCAIVFVIVCCLAMWLQLSYASKREIRWKQAAMLGAATHAGGLVFREDDGVVKYLLISSNDRSKGECVFPKGHIERGESHAEAAAREIAEETGAVVRPLRFIQTIDLGESRVVKFYLMRHLFDGVPNENEKRKVDWLPVDQAEKNLTYPESKYLLRVAEKMRQVLADA